MWPVKTCLDDELDHGNLSDVCHDHPFMRMKAAAGSAGGCFVGLTTDQQLRDMRQQLHALRHLPEAASLIMHSIDTVLIPVVGSLKV